MKEKGKAASHVLTSPVRLRLIRNDKVRNLKIFPFSNFQIFKFSNYIVPAPDILLTMNKYLLNCFFALILIACHKHIDQVNKPSTNVPAFIEYKIAKGSQYCDKSIYTPVSLDSLCFIVKFDSTAIYTTTDPQNQYDINKLYGFSDNNEDHHQFSARIGWRWSDNKLRLFGYVYNYGEVVSEEICSVNIGAEINCAIIVKGNNYQFNVNDEKLKLPRSSTTVQAIGYKLFPYFGGDETAPHDITIDIKDN